MLVNGVSLAGMPLSQWTVARVTDTQALAAPLLGAQRQAWGQVMVAVAGPPGSVLK